MEKTRIIVLGNCHDFLCDDVWVWGDWRHTQSQQMMRDGGEMAVVIKPSMYDITIKSLTLV